MHKEWEEKTTICKVQILTYHIIIEARIVQLVECRSPKPMIGVRVPQGCHKETLLHEFSQVRGYIGSIFIFRLMVNLEWFYTLNLRGKSPPFKGGNPEFDSGEMKIKNLI